MKLSLFDIQVSCVIHDGSILVLSNESSNELSLIGLAWITGWKSTDSADSIEFCVFVADLFSDDGNFPVERALKISLTPARIVVSTHGVICGVATAYGDVSDLLLFN